MLGCNCQPCAQGKTCDGKSGQCVESACVGITCGAGTYCVAGGCADACAGAACPAGQKCAGGACVAAGADAGAGGGADGGITPPTNDADGGALDGGSNNGTPAADDFGVGRKTGCSCRVVGAGGERNALWILAAALAAAIRRRRRRG